MARLERGYIDQFVADTGGHTPGGVVLTFPRGRNRCRLKSGWCVEDSFSRTRESCARPSSDQSLSGLVPNPEPWRWGERPCREHFLACSRSRSAFCLEKKRNPKQYNADSFEFRYLINVKNSRRPAQLYGISAEPWKQRQINILGKTNTYTWIKYVDKKNPLNNTIFFQLPQYTTTKRACPVQSLRVHLDQLNFYTSSQCKQVQIYLVFVDRTRRTCIDQNGLAWGYCDPAGQVGMEVFRESSAHAWNLHKADVFISSGEMFSRKYLSHWNWIFHRTLLPRPLSRRSTRTKWCSLRISTRLG